MKVCSLFSGIGGIDLGFQQAGFEIIWANEFDRDAAKTYRHNFGDTYLSKQNIKNVKTEDIPDFDVLVAGFPCQSFSSAGKQKGFDDPRGNLFFEIVRIVRDKRPSVIFLENVANLLQHDDGKTFLTIYNALVPFGYTFKYRVMDSMEYGNVPQHRSRIFIVAFLDYKKCEKFEFPDQIRRTVFLNDILQRNVKHDDSYYLEPGDPNYDFLVKLVSNKSQIYKYYESLKAYKAYRVCPTLLASMGSYPDSIPVILDDYGIRKITPHECLALLGFPKGYRFPNISMSSAYKQCGNSVVVPVIRRIAENIMKAMKNG